MFEAWIGDDGAGALEQQLAEVLAALRARGIVTYFLHGNRDFLLGADYASRAGVSLLSQPHTLDLYGMQTALLHGDSLCTLDRQYQRYRARVTNPDWQRKMLAKPLWFRRGVAGLLRTASKLRNRRSNQPRQDVATTAVEQTFRATGAVRMIHGHTHRPGQHRHRVDGRYCERIVLGDWYTQGSVLRVDADGACLQALARD